MFTFVAVFHNPPTSPTCNFPAGRLRRTVNCYFLGCLHRRPGTEFLARCRGDEMMNADSNRLERRAAQRFELHLPLAVRFEARTVSGFTQDLSARGIFFYSEASLPEGAVVELTFTMPSEITLGESMPVRCCGHVLRVAPPQGCQRSGIAVRLDSYEYLPADAGEPLSQFMRISAAAAAEGPRPLPR